MSDSILVSMKKLLNVQEDDPSFDKDITLFTNSALASLSQIGVGPAGGFMIEDAAASWEDLLGDDPMKNNIKQLVFLKVRLVFDPPGMPHVLNAFQAQIDELTWRVNVYYESNHWIDPSLDRAYPDDELPTRIVIDGGVG